ncbi:MAG: hypothetical protein L0Y56_01730, partial [Nitrospira sp.]|nr:hypothetical protein [Nitrospira sp.]
MSGRNQDVTIAAAQTDVLELLGREGAAPQYFGLNYEQNRLNHVRSAWPQGHGWAGGVFLAAPNFRRLQNTIKDIIERGNAVDDFFGGQRVNLNGRPDGDDVFIFVYDGHGQGPKPLDNDEPANDCERIQCDIRPARVICRQPQCDEALVTGTERRDNIIDNQLP